MKKIGNCSGVQVECILSLHWVDTARKTKFEFNDKSFLR